MAEFEELEKRLRAVGLPEPGPEVEAELVRRMQQLPVPNRARRWLAYAPAVAALLVAFLCGGVTGHLALPRQVVVQGPAPQVIGHIAQPPAGMEGMGGGQGGAAATPAGGAASMGPGGGGPGGGAAPMPVGTPATQIVQPANAEQERARGVASTVFYTLCLSIPLAFAAGLLAGCRVRRPGQAQGRRSQVVPPGRGQ